VAPSWLKIGVKVLLAIYFVDQRVQAITVIPVLVDKVDFDLVLAFFESTVQHYHAIDMILVHL